MRHLIVLAAFFLCIQSNAQITFRKYFQSTGNNLPRNGCVVPGGGYIICASSNAFYRLDTYGNVLWSVMIPGPVYIENVAVSSDSCFIFSGYNYNLNFSPARSEIAAGKIDANGNLLWMSVIDSTNTTIKAIPVSTSDGGVLICTTENPGSQFAIMYTGFARFSGTGQLLWHKLVHSHPSTNYLLDAEPVGGNYLVSARSDTTAWQFMLNDTGAVLWSKKNSSMPNFIYSPVDIEQFSTGIVTTNKLNNLFFFDTLSNAVTERKYAVAGGTLTLENLLATSDGGLLVGGRVIRTASDSSMLLMKTDAGGNVLWATMYDTTVRYIRNMEETPDGYLITREMQSTTQMMVLKTDLQGHAFCHESNVTITMTPVTGLTSSVLGNVVTASIYQSYYPVVVSSVAHTYTEWTMCASVGIAELEQVNDNEVYPNPSAGVLYFHEPYSSERKMKLYTIKGELIWEGFTVNNSIDLSTQPDGVYFLEISNGEHLSVEKLVLAH